MNKSEKRMREMQTVHHGDSSVTDDHQSPGCRMKVQTQVSDIMS